MDIVKIKVWVPDQKALNEVLTTAKVSLDCGSPRQDESGDFVVNQIHFGPRVYSKL
jgi:hypothetical protein